MLSTIGAPGYILLVILALLLFGPNKLPELGRAVGRTFREFKDGARDIMSDAETPKRNDAPPAAQTADIEPPQDHRRTEQP